MRMRQSSKTWVNCQMKIPLDFLRLMFPQKDFLSNHIMCNNCLPLYGNGIKVQQ